MKKITSAIKALSDPTRVNEPDRNKIVVTACPHKDRAGLALAYLIKAQES